MSLNKIIGMKFEVYDRELNKYTANVVQHTPANNGCTGFFTLLVYKPEEAQKKAYVVTVDEKRIYTVINNSPILQGI